MRRETQRHGIASATEGALWRPGWPGAQPWQGQWAVAWLPSTLLLPSTVTLPVSPHPHAGKGQNYFFVSSSQTWREGKTRGEGPAIQLTITEWEVFKSQNTVASADGISNAFYLPGCRGG